MEGLLSYKQIAPPSSAGFSFGKRKGRAGARVVRLASRPAGTSLPLAASVCPPLGRCGLPPPPPSLAFSLVAFSVVAAAVCPPSAVVSSALPAQVGGEKPRRHGGEKEQKEKTKIGVCASIVLK